MPCPDPCWDCHNAILLRPGPWETLSEFINRRVHSPHDRPLGIQSAEMYAGDIRRTPPIHAYLQGIGKG